MRKISILRKKIIKSYNNHKNQEFSRSKGYPKDTYFGYASLNDYIKDTLKEFTEFYGKGLRKWRYK